MIGHLIYIFFIQLYSLSLRIASTFSEKIRKAHIGRKLSFEQILTHIPENKDLFWFHSSSLGEFEQGKPLLIELRKRYPDSFFLQTFFSPSGFEIRNNDPLIDLAVYLPTDTIRNAKKFVSIIKPKAVFFIKYDFWFHYIRELHRNSIPLYYVSSIFKKDQYFFKWGMKWFRAQLKKVSMFFVQDKASSDILIEYGIKQVIISGDTRNDNVLSTLTNSKPIDLIESFAGEHNLFVAGSCWQEDEELLFELMNKAAHDWKFILAPHDVSDGTIKAWQDNSPLKSVKYSSLNSSVNLDTRVLLIDNIGMLSDIYQYADLVYVGGGFGKGVHNILEAAVFGTTVCFGPIYEHFVEAQEMIDNNYAFSDSSLKVLSSKLLRLINNKDERIEVGGKAAKYILESSGATKIIIENLPQNF